VGGDDCDGGDRILPATGPGDPSGEDPGTGDGAGSPPPGPSDGSNSGLAAGQGGGDGPAGGTEETRQTRRYFKIRNGTNEELTVSLQYYTQDERGGWAWYPADPSRSQEAISFKIGPGVETFLAHNNWRINASRARIWAVTPSNYTWPAKDFWLVPEVGEDGAHYYYSTEMYIHQMNFLKRE
jgi:hypothetical protein